MSYGPKPSIAPRFAERIDRLLLVFIPDFNIGATIPLSGLENTFASFVVNRTA